MNGPRATTSSNGERPYNNLLRRLNSADYALIVSHLSRQEAAANDLLYNPGALCKRDRPQAPPPPKVAALARRNMPAQTIFVF